MSPVRCVPEALTESREESPLRLRLFNDNHSSPALPASGAFQPQGTLGRTLLIITNSPERLTAVQEVQIGQASYGSGKLTVVTRLVIHRLAAGGATGTLAQSGEALRLGYRIVQTNGTVLSGTEGPVNTLSNGTASFEISGLPLDRVEGRRDC